MKPCFQIKKFSIFYFILCIYFFILLPSSSFSHHLKNAKDKAASVCFSSDSFEFLTREGDKPKTTARCLIFTLDRTHFCFVNNVQCDLFTFFVCLYYQQKRFVFWHICGILEKLAGCSL
jgi:hypothetical protein